MSIKDLQHEAKRIRDAAVRAYRHERITHTRRIERRETDAQIRAALRAHDLGNAAFD